MAKKSPAALKKQVDRLLNATNNRLWAATAKIDAVESKKGWSDATDAARAAREKFATNRAGTIYRAYKGLLPPPKPRTTFLPPTGKPVTTKANGDRYTKAWATRIAKYGSAGSRWYSKSRFFTPKKK